jgi:hypothetical protein
MSAATAGIVLANRTLRWSSPLLFNDPFDVPREFAFGVKPEEVAAASAKRLISILEHPPPDDASLDWKMRLIMAVARKGLPPGFTEKLSAEFEGVANTITESKSMDSLRELWKSWLPELRILCLTESPRHMAMWYHYAEEYRGAVLEFRCDEALVSPLLLAQQVTYPPAHPEVYTASGLAELLSMPIEQAKRRLFDVATLTKSPDWSYECEWRIVSFRRPSNQGLFTDYEFNPLELAAVYLGPLMSAADREKLSQLASGYPSAAVMNVSIGMSRDLQFSNAP